MMSAMRYDIIPAAPADAPELLALQELAFRTEAELYGDWNIPPLTENLAQLQHAFARLVVLKALGHGPDAAQGLLGCVRAQLDEAGVCHIGRLAVRPDARRMGLGSALLEAAGMAFAGARRLRLFTGSKSEDNLRLYRRLGFAEVERRQAAPGLTLVFLERPGPASR
jgi:ribosomal protein S18 acetylase RimI-like enzyme